MMNNDGQNTNNNRNKIINLMIGDFHLSTVPGPSSSVLKNTPNTTVLSISIQGLPQCGPWAMSNGPKAVELAKRAIQQAMDVPLWMGIEENHYELHIDASYFVAAIDDNKEQEE